MNQSDLDKLKALHAAARLPLLAFDPTNTGYAHRQYFGLVCPEAYIVPGINIDAWSEETRDCVNDDGVDLAMTARAEYVALACNIAPDLADANAAMTAAMRNAISWAVDAQEEWAKVDAQHAPEWTYPYKRIIAILEEVIGKTEVES